MKNKKLTLRQGEKLYTLRRRLRAAARGYPVHKPLSEEPIDKKALHKHLTGFITAAMDNLSAEAMKNALIILGDAETIEREGVIDPNGFKGQLAYDPDTNVLASLNRNKFYEHVRGYYDPETNVLVSFEQPEDTRLLPVIFVVDDNRETVSIHDVEFPGGPVNAHLKALKGLPLVWRDD